MYRISLYIINPCLHYHFGPDILSNTVLCTNKPSLLSDMLTFTFMFTFCFHIHIHIHRVGVEIS